MLKYILSLCLLAGASASAETVFTPRMEYEILSKKDMNFSGIVDTLTLHTLSIIASNHKTITLTDGSEWHIGFFWKTKLSSWCPGDQLRFTIHLDNTFNIVRIENLNQHSVVWGNLALRSDVETTDARWIVSTYIDSFVELNDGSVFRTRTDYSPNKSGWGTGDTIFLLGNDDVNNPYILWNMTWGTVMPASLFSPPVISN